MSSVSHGPTTSKPQEPPLSRTERLQVNAVRKLARARDYRKLAWIARSAAFAEAHGLASQPARVEAFVQYWAPMASVGRTRKANIERLREEALVELANETPKKGEYEGLFILTAPPRPSRREVQGH